MEVGLHEWQAEGAVGRRITVRRAEVTKNGRVEAVVGGLDSIVSGRDGERADP